MASLMRDAARERRWRDALQRYSRSGLGVREFCRREKLPESAFYFWRSEVARRDAEIRVASTPARKTPPLPSFLPVRVSDNAAHGASITLKSIDATRHEASITLELAGGRVLRLSETIPVQRLAEIIVALEATRVVARAAR